MGFINEPTEEEIKRYTKDVNGATLLDGKIVRIPATKDYMFKNLFGINGKEENLRNLLQAILKIEIESLEIQNPETQRNSKDDKKCILDVKAKLSNGTICFIEMQVKDEHNIGERATFYMCKLYTNTIESGERYSDIGKTVAIIITDFSYFNRREYHQIAHLKFEECMDLNEIVEELSDIESEIITDKFELHIIDLKKFKKLINAKGELASWLKLIIGDEEGIFMASKNNEAIKKANEDNRILSLNKDMQEDYWYELKAKLDRNTELYIREKEKKEYEDKIKAREEKIRAREEKIKAREEKIKAIQEEAKVAQEEGRKKGIQQGIERGAKEEKIKIAKTMKERNVKIEDIISFTGLSKEEVEAIS